MKKQLTTLAAIMAVAGSVFGQGQVTMANNASSLVTSQLTGQAVAIGSTSFQLYFTTPGGLPSSLQPVGPIVGTSTAFIGRIANTIIDIPSATIPFGTAAQFQVWAWQSSFASYSAALAGGGLTGQSAIFNASTSPAGPPPPAPTSLAGLFPGFEVRLVPEPSTFALAGLGAASLLLFRRRK
jgi:hypothetical protein